MRRRRAIVLGGAALLAVVIGVLGFGYWRENIARGQETVATVFGQRITAGELVDETRPRLASLEARVAFFRENGMTQQASQLQLQRQRLPESIMSELVEDRVVQREAARRGIEVGPGDIDEGVRKLVAEAQAASEPEPGPTATLTEDRFGPALQDTLKRSGFTEAQLRGLARDEIYDERLRELLGQEVPAQQEHVLARHIVFRDEAEANDALGQLQGGASFEELARTRSQDQATRDKGGDLGWLPRLGRDRAFDEALFALQPGQLSGVVRTDSGWEILQVIDRDLSRAVDETQLEEMRRRHYGTWLAAAVGSPEIERSLTPEISSWVLQRAASRRS